MEGAESIAGGRENALRAHEALGQFLQDDEWYPQPLERVHAYRVGYVGTNGQVTCFAQIEPDLEQFIFYVLCPMKADEQARPAVAEYITRANFGLRIGNLELDYEDGEVRYKSSIDFEDGELTPQLMRNAIYSAVRTMDRYLGGLFAVMYGGKSAPEAIQEIEGT